MDLMELYRETAKRLSRIDLDSLFRGFSPLRFAVYSGNECCLDGELIEKPAAFVANTSVEYEGGQVAIWDVSHGIGDLDEFAASMVHEMFHGFQNLSGESRYPDENAALRDYVYSAKNVSLKLKEAELMRNIVENGDKASYDTLLSMRKRRLMDFPFEYRYEAATEQIEGTANYIELAALFAIAPEKAAMRWKRLFERILDPKEYFPIRIVSYLTGAAFIECAKRMGGPDFDTFKNEPYAVEAVTEAPAYEGNIETDPAVSQAMESFIDETKRIIEAAVEKNDVVLNERRRLASVNIWDARRLGDLVTSNFFVAYIDDGEWKPLYGDFVVELDGEYIKKVYRR